MNILIDTNIIIDYIAERKPYFEDSRLILESCKLEKINGCVSSQSIADIFYILRKSFSEKERRSILVAICKILEVESVDKNKLILALENSLFKDFEDCLQYHCAKSFRADYIITRNISDFSGSDIPCILPSDFCKEYLKE